MASTHCYLVTTIYLPSKYKGHPDLGALTREETGHDLSERKFRIRFQISLFNFFSGNFSALEHVFGIRVFETVNSNMVLSVQFFLYSL